MWRAHLDSHCEQQTLNHQASVTLSQPDSVLPQSVDWLPAHSCWWRQWLAGSLTFKPFPSKNTCRWGCERSANSAAPRAGWTLLEIPRGTSERLNKAAETELTGERDTGQRRAEEGEIYDAGAVEVSHCRASLPRVSTSSTLPSCSSLSPSALMQLSTAAAALCLPPSAEHSRSEPLQRRDPTVTWLDPVDSFDPEDFFHLFFFECWLGTFSELRCLIRQSRRNLRCRLRRFGQNSHLDSEESRMDFTFFWLLATTLMLIHQHQGKATSTSVFTLQPKHSSHITFCTECSNCVSDNYL